MPNLTTTDTKKKTIIVGVGRSGTTIIHRLILELYQRTYTDKFDQIYEPFLWDSSALKDYPRDGARETRFGDSASLSHLGLHFHQSLPLIMDKVDEATLPDGIRSYLNADNNRPLVAKFIRASGRLPLLYHLYPDAKFILLIRNPLDVVNSVVTKFSFFGEENHASDFPRFKEEVLQHFGRDIQENGADISVPAKAALWCHFMVMAALRASVGQSNSLLVVYEDLKSNPEKGFRRICDHIGIPYEDAYATIAKTPVGRVTTGQRSITAEDVEAIHPLFDDYWTLAQSESSVTDVDRQEILDRYSPAHLAPHPPVYRGFGWSPVRTEGHIIRLAEELELKDATRRRDLASVQRKAVLNAAPKRNDWRVPISAIVTSFNNCSTISQAIDSLRQQTFSPNQILIADDSSTDGSQDLLRRLAKEDDRITLILREQNIGVSANRNDAIKECTNTFVTQIDGDDHFDPHKIQREAYTLLGSEDSVAFSDTLFLSNPPTNWDCSWLTALSGRDAVDGMVSRRGPLPRDMLLSKALFFKAGGYRENCSIYEDWALKIRLAETARDWRYSGTAGTFYRPGGLSQAGADKLLLAGLWVLSCDVQNLLCKTETLPSAFEAILNLNKISYPVETFQDNATRDVVAAKVEHFFGEVKSIFGGNGHSVSKEVGNDILSKTQHLINTIGVLIGASAK